MDRVTGRVKSRQMGMHCPHHITVILIQTFFLQISKEQQLPAINSGQIRRRRERQLQVGTVRQYHFWYHATFYLIMKGPIGPDSAARGGVPRQRRVCEVPPGERGRGEPRRRRRPHTADGGRHPGLHRSRR